MKEESHLKYPSLQVQVHLLSQKCANAFTVRLNARTNKSAHLQAHTQTHMHTQTVQYKKEDLYAGVVNICTFKRKNIM